MSTFKQLYDGIEAALSQPAKTLEIYHALAATTDASLYDVVSGCNALYRANRICPTAKTADALPNEIVWELVTQDLPHNAVEVVTGEPVEAWLHFPEGGKPEGAK